MKKQPVRFATCRICRCLKREALLERLRQEEDRFASQRKEDYLAVRRHLEDQVRQLFMEKGGKPKRLHPHYFVLGDCAWLKSWYPHGCELQILLEEFNAESISFTYGDTFPAMRYRDGKPYRGKVYIHLGRVTHFGAWIWITSGLERGWKIWARALHRSTGMGG